MPKSASRLANSAVPPVTLKTPDLKVLLQMEDNSSSFSMFSLNSTTRSAFVLSGQHGL